MDSMKNASRPLIAVLTVATILGFAGCSSEPPAPEASSDASTSAEPAVEEMDTDKVMRELVTAVYGNDFATSESLVAPESAAAKYVTHQKSSDTAYKANGDFTPPVAADQPSLEFEDGAVTAKYPGGMSFTWSEFEFDESGLVTSWTTPSGQLPSLLWSADFAGAVAGNSVNLTSAYKTNAGEMHVVLTVTAGSSGIDFMMPYQAQFVASDGIAYTAQYSSAPGQSLPAGATGYVVLAFPQVPFGGTIYLEGYNVGSPDIWKAEIPVS